MPKLLTQERGRIEPGITPAASMHTEKPGRIHHLFLSVNTIDSVLVLIGQDSPMQATKDFWPRKERSFLALSSVPELGKSPKSNLRASECITSQSPMTSRVVARVILVPDGIWRTFSEIDHYYPKLLGFFTNFVKFWSFWTPECWAPGLKLLFSGGLCRPPPPTVATTLMTRYVFLQPTSVACLTISSWPWWTWTLIRNTLSILISTKPTTL